MSLSQLSDVTGDSSPRTPSALANASNSDIPPEAAPALSKLSNLLRQTKVTIDESVAETRKDVPDFSNAEALREREVLQRELLRYERENEMLKRFRDKKDTFEQQIQDLQAALDSKDRKHENEIRALNQKHETETCKLRADLEKRAGELAASQSRSVAQPTDNKHGGGRNALAENENLAKELELQCKRSAEILRQNDKLIDENRDMRSKLHVHAEMEVELKQKLQAQQVAIQLLSTKLSSLKELMGHLKQQRGNALNMVPVADYTKATEKVLELDTALERERRRSDRLQEEVKQERKRLNRIDNIHDDLVKFLLDAIDDLKFHIANFRQKKLQLAQQAPYRQLRNGTEHGSPTRLTSHATPAVDPRDVMLGDLSLEERENVLRYILSRLRVLKISFQPHGSQARGSPDRTQLSPSPAELFNRRGLPEERKSAFELSDREELRRKLDSTKLPPIRKDTITSSPSPDPRTDSSPLRPSMDAQDSFLSPEFVARLSANLPLDRSSDSVSSSEEVARVAEVVVRKAASHKNLYAGIGKRPLFAVVQEELHGTET